MITVPLGEIRALRRRSDRSFVMFAGCAKRTTDDPQGSELRSRRNVAQHPPRGSGSRWFADPAERESWHAVHDFVVSFRAMGLAGACAQLLVRFLWFVGQLACPRTWRLLRQRYSLPVTERPRAVPAARGLQLLIDSIRDYAIFMLDLEGRITTWNRGARAIKGYEPHEIIGKSIELFYTPEDLVANLPAKLLARAREHERVEDQGWRVRKDGSRFWADVVITVLRDPAGTVVGYAKVTRDCTERRRIEEQRLEAEQRFRMLVEGVTDYAIFMLDCDGKIETWNPGAERLKGYTASEILGESLSRFYPVEDIEAGKPEIELATALSEGRYEDQGWRLRKDGTRFWANVILTPLHNPAGVHVGFAKITRDLTERREAEAERLRLVEATTAIRMRDDFLSIASHELRTPLMALQLQLESAQQLLETDGNPKLAHKLQRADRSVARLTELVDTLLDVSRIATGKLTINPRTVNFADIVNEVVDRMQEAASQVNCKLTSSVRTRLVGNFDSLRIGQMLTNLLSNAFKYAAGTEVEVELESSDTEIVLRVNDRGPGIEAGQLQRIFGRFERAAESRYYSGLGLGLYVASEIAKAHHGAIRADNRDGGGAMFEVRLPSGGA
jgi:PAS domain S-box-containing protein